MWGRKGYRKHKASAMSGGFSLTRYMMCLQDLKPQAYRNAYDIPRRNLLDQLTRMRSNLLRTSQKLIRGQDEGTVYYPNTEETIKRKFNLEF